MYLHNNKFINWNFYRIIAHSTTSFCGVITYQIICTCFIYAINSVSFLGFFKFSGFLFAGKCRLLCTQPRLEFMLIYDYLYDYFFAVFFLLDYSFSFDIKNISNHIKFLKNSRHSQIQKKTLERWNANEMYPMRLRLSPQKIWHCVRTQRQASWGCYLICISTGTNSKQNTINNKKLINLIIIIQEHIFSITAREIQRICAHKPNVCAIKTLQLKYSLKLVGKSMPVTSELSHQAWFVSMAQDLELTATTKAEVVWTDVEGI